MELKKLSLTEIKPYWRNPRNNEPAIDAVMQSIQQYGYTVPIVVDKKNVIIAGHTRYKALVKLGTYETIDVVVFSGSKAKATEYRIIDNKTSEMATWLPTELSAELREVKNLSDLQIFFPTVSVAELVTDANGMTNNLGVSAEDIEQKQGELVGAYKTLSDRKEADKIECICPECKAMFWLDKRDIMKLSK